MLSREQQREILALVVLAAAVFVTLALVPVGVLGPRGSEWFPSGNAVGAVGRSLRGALLAALGVGAALVPVLVALAGLRVGDWLSRGWTLRLVLLTAGLLLLIPTGLHVTAAPPIVSGWIGRALGGPLTGSLGWLGASLLLLVALVLLSVGTLGWNPLRPMGRAVVAGGGALGRSVQQAGGAVGKEIQERLRTRAETGKRNGRGTGAGSEEGVDPETTPAPALREEGDPGPDASPARPARGARPKTRDIPDPVLPDPQQPWTLEGDTLPPMELLEAPDVRDRRGMERELDGLGEVLIEKLRTFGVESEIGGRTTGPVVTQFEVVPAPGVKVNRIANLDADLALAMKARSIRIVAPIPGKGAVGVEIPNPEPATVYLREILEAPAFQSSRAALPLALGKDLTGRPFVSDLAKMPHALIAGATGSGKSVCLNTIITSLVYRHSPRTMRLLLIDPKMVELSTYSDLPHLRHPVVTDPRDAAGVLKWAVLEMERRYTLLGANGVRSLAEFNRRVADGVVLRRAEAEGPEGDPARWIYEGGVLPYVVLVIDELADLMMTVQGEVEKPLTLLAQKARAIGIHLIVATQRPSVNVITGLIKANFPCRIAFRVASKTDSRTILDQNGADALLGNGDMLFMPPGHSEPVRMQGAFIPTADTDRLMGWFRDRAAEQARKAEGAEPSPAEEDILDVVRTLEAEEAGGFDGEGGPTERDELFRAAAEVCVQNAQGSTSLLQRKLRIGYGRAARIVDQLHEAGILGPPDGSKPREVLISVDDVERL